MYVVYKEYLFIRTGFPEIGNIEFKWMLNRRYKYG